MICSMSGRFFIRQIVMLVLALGVFLGAATPSWAAFAMSAKASMSTGMSMAMQGDCMDVMVQGDHDKKIPQKDMRASCGMCVACALQISVQAPLLAERLYRSAGAVFAHDVNLHGIAVLPALPPPIA